MRRIGSLSNPRLAERFRGYLETRSIDAVCLDGEGGQVDVWVRDEAAIETGRLELAAFVGNPEDAKYSVKDKVDRLREQKIAERIRQLKNFRQMPRSGGGRGILGGGARQTGTPLTIALIAISCLASFATNFSKVVQVDPGRFVLTPELRLSWALSFVNRIEYATSQGDSFASIKRGEVWRLVTPIFLHGSVLHLLFNMLWIYTLGSAIERLHGTWFFAGLFLLTGIGGMLLQVVLPDWFPSFLRGTPFAIGASGAVYGLFGFIWIRPKVDPLYPIAIPPQNVALMLGWLVLCMTPVIPGVANGAHLGGLIAGVFASWAFRQRSV